MIWNWQITPSQAWPPFVQAQVDALEADLVALVEEMLPAITAFMQREARWTDRTGDARSSLFSALIHEARRTVGILVSHGSLIDYGIWLELAHAGRFAIIAPTVDEWGPVFFDRVQELVRRRFA